MTTPLGAASAYLKAAGVAAPRPQLAEAPTGGFGALVAQGADRLSGMARASDAASLAALSGKADMVDVVTAITQTEAALETLVAIRDRVIASYDDIMRMPV